jgi:thrombospondin type 3 repeat-containing domain protein
MIKTLFAFVLFFTCIGGYAQSYWKESNIKQSIIKQKKKCTYYSLNKKFFENTLHTMRDRSIISSICVDIPNGSSIKTYRVYKTEVLSPSMARKYPKIETYSGYAIDDPNQLISFTWSPSGVSAILENDFNYTFIQPINKKGKNYKVYHRGDVLENIHFDCTTRGSARGNMVEISTFTENRNYESDHTLRTIRIAVATTSNFTKYFGGKAKTLAQIVSTIQRVNQIFRSQMSIQFQLVSGEETLIEEKREDNLSNYINEGWTGSELQKFLDDKIGVNNYDVGHLFHHTTNNPKGNSGCVGCVCDNNNKGKAFSAGNMDSIEMDRFDIDFFCHELGHQMGANHVHNLQNEGYGVQIEPGSGSTIMGYAGITGRNDVQSRTDPYFNHISVQQILDYIKKQSCPTTENMDNTPAQIRDLGNYTIPKGTAYVLNGTAIDIDGDKLYYTWEQADNSGSITYDRFSPDILHGPMARSLPPSESSLRYIPRISRILQGVLTERNPNIDSSWETVSNVERKLTWAFMVMDRRVEHDSKIKKGYTIGNTSFAHMEINVASDAGPFKIISDKDRIYWFVNKTHTIIWEVANTDKGKVNAQKVDIYFSKDGGATFPMIIAQDILNNGSYTFTIPTNLITTQGRYMIKAKDNIFLAVNIGQIIVQEDGDMDRDGVPDSQDNCIEISNSDQKDTDGDGIGDICDDDIDEDGILNMYDNCRNIPNVDQKDTDRDGIGDVCDEDIDNDGIINDEDNCPYEPNFDQKDTDNDGKGDKCSGDKDKDGVLDEMDNCPDISNSDQSDIDGDGIGNVCDKDMDGDGILNSQDNCPEASNKDQKDTDEDGIGDVCDDDIDNDGIFNEKDNCTYVANSDQKDTDGDGIGDVCDDDIDNDGISNKKDNCPIEANPNQEDTDKDGIGDICDTDIDGDGIDNSDDKEDDIVLIPNAFTPNGDGINDNFYIQRISLYPQNTLRIFTRQGQLIYQVNGYKNQWNGIGIDGVKVQQGFYYYLLTLKKTRETREGWLYINY